MNVAYYTRFNKNLKKISKSDKQIAETIISKMDEVGEALCNIDHPYKVLNNVGLDRLTTNRFVERNVPAYRIRIGKYRVFVTVKWENNSILVHGLEKRSQAYDTHKGRS